MQKESPDGSEMIPLSEVSPNWRVHVPVDESVYAKGQTPAITDPVMLTVEEEAQGLYRRILKSDGGERQHNVAALQSEMQILRRNQSKGYSGWEFRIQVLKRTLELLGVST